MNVYLNEITGIADMITTLYFSKRSWSREKEEEIRKICNLVNTREGKLRDDIDEELKNQYLKLMTQATKLSTRHITIGRFMDFSITVEGLHRAGQDDWDAHAKRYNNRIIRSSTRLATFDYEMSDYYKGKIIPTDVALAHLGLIAPDSLEYDGNTYVKTVNGYIREDLKDNKDVKRGLYMLSIPSNFIFKVDATEWSHVYKERNIDGTANPEVKDCCEIIADKIEEFQPMLTRDLWKAIKN